MSLTQSMSIVALLAPLALLVPVSAAASDQTPPHVQHLPKISSIILCDGRPVHLRDLAWSPCNHLTPRTKSAQAAATEQPQALAQSVVDGRMLGRKKLTICDGGWVAPNLSRGAFPCTEWVMNVSDGYVYAAYQSYPEVTVYNGLLETVCGPAAVTIAIETPTPDIAQLAGRVNTCDPGSVVGNIPQVYVLAEASLYAKDPTNMAGTMTSVMYDNTALDGKPKWVRMFHGALSVIGIR